MDDSDRTWVAISGSWRTTTPEVETDVRRDVKALMQRGEGMVSGGALGVDFIATDEALKNDPMGQQIRIILPTSLPLYAAHYRQRAIEGKITSAQAEALIAQLEEVKRRNPTNLIEMGATLCNEETYYARNTAVVAHAQSLLAYQVNGSLGVADTIRKARENGLEIVHRTYTVAE